MMKLLAPLIAGLLFGAGLVVSGMTDSANVIGFLDVTGNWMPALALVMGGAIAVNVGLTALALKRTAPLFESRFWVPVRKDIDRPLLVGAALFGIGWGLGGFCPGPGLVAAAAGNLNAIAFVVSMTVGMYGFKMWQARAPSEVHVPVTLTPQTTPELPRSALQTSAVDA